MLEVTIEKEFYRWIMAAGLESFSQFMTKPVGELLDSGRNGRELRRIKISIQEQTRIFYLKRLAWDPFGKLIQMVLFGYLPRSGPLREQLLLKRLNNAGFATMRTVAYGERRRFGWPMGGFLLVEEVQGVEVAEFYQSCSTATRHHLMTALGAYLGRLHKAGFFQTVRLKDLFLKKISNDANGGFDFVLIDRETSKPGPSRFAKFRSLEALARAARRTLRDGYALEREDVVSFCRGYHQVLGQRFGLSCTALRRELFSAYRKEMQRARK